MLPISARGNALSPSTFAKRSFAVLTVVLFLMSFAAASSDVEGVNTDDVKQLMRQADKAARRGDLDRAEELLRQAEKSEPNNSSAKLQLAYVLVKVRKLNEAYDLSFPIAKNEPKNSMAFAVLGATLLNAGRFHEAELVLGTSIKLNRRQALAWAGFGMLNFYENQIPTSLKFLREAVYHDPDDPDFVYALAQVSARAEQFHEAAEAYNRFLSISKNTDDDRRARIKGLVSFLRYLGQRSTLYTTTGEAQTSVKFQLLGNRPVIRVKVNDREEPLNFVLDTGSGISVISMETAEKLGINEVARGGHARGVGGDGKFEIVYGFIKQFDIGEVRIKNVPVYIRKFHSPADHIDGYIGLSLISKFLTTIDYGRQQFILAKARNDSSTIAASKGISLPLRLTTSGFLSGEVQLQGVETPLNFIVDTGASVSVISDDVAGLQGITPFASDERMRVVGSAGVTEDVPSFLLPKVSFGEHSRKSIMAIALDLDAINEASGFQQSGILGGNFLRNYRMTFDFRNSKVTFVPIGLEP